MSIGRAGGRGQPSQEPLRRGGKALRRRGEGAKGNAFAAR
jgi:hypothetical protein